MTDFTVLVESAAFKLTFAFIAVALLMGTLRIFDRLNGLTFSDILTELRQSDGTAVAIYFGARIIAVAILIGMAL